MTSSTGQRAFWAVLLLAGALLLATVAPIAKALFVALVLAGALHPLFRRLASKLGGRNRLAAGLTTAGLVLVILIPLGALAFFLVDSLAPAADFLRSSLAPGGLGGLLQRLPRPLSAWARALGGLLQSGGASLESLSAAQTGRAAGFLGRLIAAASRSLLQLALMLIAFVFLLLDGPGLLAWVDQNVPLRPGQLRELLGEFRATSVAVMLSSIATAGAQAAVALVGYLIARVPNPVAFALVTFILAFIPAVGAAVVSVALAGVLLLRGHLAAAIFLAAWGVLFVSTVDNLIKPLLIRRGVEQPGAVVFFSLIGGLAAFGPVGVLLGPLAVTFFLSALRIYHRDYPPHL